MSKSAKREHGWVTVEMAFAVLGVGLVVALCAGGLNLGLIQIRCHDAAHEIARQAAREDLEAVKEVSDRLPDSAIVEISAVDKKVGVSVSIDVSPWGSWLPPIRVHSEAWVSAEGRLR